MRQLPKARTQQNRLRQWPKARNQQNQLRQWRERIGYKAIAEELREILKELEQHSESLIREYDQTVRDQQAMKRTIEILNKEQPAVNGVSQETPPVA